jgi:ATP/maltotriose-dependent transcriptional regulator MalT
VTPLLERDSVQAAVAGLVRGARSGRAGALFVVGEAGIGKTAVLDHARALAGEHGFRVGAGHGEAMEATLPFGLMAQVLTGLGGDALDGPGVVPAGPDARAARFYAVWRWLEQSASDPVLFAIDDLHWSDADSLALLSFLCRRLAGLPAAVIATLRPWPQEAHLAAAGLAHDGRASIERLAPLSRPGVAALLTARSGRHVSEAEIDRAAEVTAGNPLLLEQVALTLAQGLGIARLAGWRGHPEQLLLTRFAGVPAAGLGCARAAAVLGTRFRPELAVALADLDRRHGDQALDALERSGLVRASRAGGAEFAHPLFRQALYDDLGESLRARLHAQAFSLLAERGLNDEAAEHAMKAGLAGDSAAISVLTNAGRAARARGATATALSLLESAAALAGSHAGAELLCDLAEMMAAGGRPADAAGVCERLLERPGLAIMVRARALRAHAQALTYLGAIPAGRRRIDECVDLAEAANPAFAVDTLLASSLVSWIVTGPSAAIAVTRRARDIARSCDDAVRRSADAAWALSALETGDAGGVEICQAAARAAEADLAGEQAARVLAGSGALHSYATAARYLDRLSESEHYYRARLCMAEDLGLAEAEASALVGCIDTLMRRLRLADAFAMAERCAILADLVPLAGPFAEIARVNLLLLMGRLEEFDQAVKRAEPVVAAIGAWCATLYLWYGQGWRCLSEGRLAQACALYEQIEATTARVGLREPCEVPWAVHAVAAYIRSGRPGDAWRVMSWLEDCGQSLPCRWPRLAALLGRAVVADAQGDRTLADELFRQAMQIERQVDIPLQRIQTLLEYGRFLRRSGQPLRARPLLAQAAELGESSGADWLAAQARQELRAAGGRRRRKNGDPSRLTPQEERVAALAATGATNAEIARQLYVSVSTVETHLEHVFAKLTIASRRQLAAALASRAETGPHSAPQSSPVATD